MTDLSITVNGMTFDNPFVLGSGPPGTNGKVIARSFDLGWGGMVCKTFSLDAAAEAWRHGGYHVIGAALAATAAAQLQTQTAIPSDTIALRTLQLANGALQLDGQTVVVIDEAAMASTRGKWSAAFLSESMMPSK